MDDQKDAKFYCVGFEVAKMKIYQELFKPIHEKPNNNKCQHSSVLSFSSEDVQDPHFPFVNLHLPRSALAPPRRGACHTSTCTKKFNYPLWAISLVVSEKIKIIPHQFSFLSSLKNWLQPISDTDGLFHRCLRINMSLFAVFQTHWWTVQTNLGGENSNMF